MLVRMWRQSNPHTLLVECELILTLWKTVCRLLKKLKIELPDDLETPLLGINLKECKSSYNKGTPMFTAIGVEIAKLWK
jgi:hypothetical protein